MTTCDWQRRFVHGQGSRLPAPPARQSRTGEGPYRKATDRSRPRLAGGVVGAKWSRGPEDIQRAVENAKGLGRFIRSLVGLDRQAVNAKFAEFLDGTTATANQIDFIGVVVSYLTRYGAMEPAQLYDPPFTDNAPKGPDEFFPPTQMARLIAIIRSINASADVQTA